MAGIPTPGIMPETLGEDEAIQGKAVAMILLDLANFSDGAGRYSDSQEIRKVAFSSDSPYICVYSWDFYCYHFCSSWMSREQLLI
jgi:hypothetical protein